MCRYFVTQKWLETQKISETESHLQLVYDVLKTMGSWRAYIIALDGRDGTGKSTIGRYLSWKTGIPCIETDAFIAEYPDYLWGEMRGLLVRRFDKNKPTVIEGIFAAELLRKMGLKEDLLVRITAVDVDGSDDWQDQFQEYEKSFLPHYQFESGVTY